MHYYRHQRVVPHLTLFVGALITGAGIATAAIAWHFQGPLSDVASELLKYGKIGVGVGFVLHILAFVAYSCD